MRYLIIFFFTALMFLSCEKTLDVNLPDTNRKIVVNAMFSNDSVFSVNVSKSLSILDRADVLFIDNATVKLFENGVYIQDLVYLNKGFYSADSLIPKVNHEYKVTVEVPDLTTVEAKGIMPPGNSILSIDTATFVVNNYNEKQLECNLRIIDPSTTDYYMLNIYKINKNYYDTNDIRIYPYNIWFESNDLVFRDSVPTNLGGVIFKDDMINGKDLKIKLRINQWDLYDYEADSVDLYFRLSTVTQDYYYYMKSYHMYENTHNNPFAEPVQVFTNVENGLGIFTGYTYNEFKLRVPNYDNELIW